MPRHQTELPSTLKREIRMRTARGESAATIRAALGSRGPSTSTLKRRQRELRGKSAAKRPSPPKRIAAPDAPASVVEPGSLYRELWSAEDDVAAARALRDCLAADDPELREALTAGVPLVRALADQAQYADVIGCIRDPHDLADLARLVTADHAPLGYEREEGETTEHFDRYLAEIKTAAHRRAVALLATALEIVRAPDAASERRRIP